MAPGIEGMIHLTELAEEAVAKPQDAFKEGDDIEFIVLASDTDERKFSLSRRAFLKNLQGEALKDYIGTVTEPKTGLADAFAKAQAANKKDDAPE